jgi:serine/threonine protein kinase
LTVASNSKHADDAELGFLLLGDEDSDEYRAAAAHIETCEACRNRLEAMSGSRRFDDEARQLLSGYPWEDFSRSQSAEPNVVAVPDLTQSLDFLSPPSHPEMLGRLGRYEIERVVGTGGMGIVLKAFDTELNRPVAIKVLARHLAHRGAARQRFTREAKAAAAIVHEHVVAIHNVEADRNVPFLVRQYVAGESLQARVDREGPLDVKEILRIGIQAASGLAAAHEQGVIHRDIKPANILLENGVERLLLTDFGLARTVDDASLTHTGVVTGTPHYMSPEQANGDSTDHRTDLFSLGCVLYAMATGHPPFRAERAMGVLNRICHDRHRPVWAVNPDIPDELSEIIDQLLEKRPSRRYASAADVQEALARLLSCVQQHPRNRRRPVARIMRRHRVGIGLPCGLALLLVAAVVILWPRLPGSHSNSPSSKTVTPTIAAPSAESVAQDAQALVAELTADATVLRDLSERIERLDGALSLSQFSRSFADDFPSDVQSLDQTLDRLNDQAIPDFPRLQPKRARR